MHNIFGYMRPENWVLVFCGDLMVCTKGFRLLWKCFSYESFLSSWEITIF